ncbi:MAG: mechanosensitive ion channel [Dehalococcoidia bacterium]
MDPAALFDGTSEIGTRQIGGVAAVLVAALVAQALYLVGATLVIRRRTSRSRQRFWRNERRRLDRLAFGLIAGLAFIVGGRYLELEPDVEDAVQVAARLVAVVSGGLLLLRGIAITGDYFLDRAGETATRLDDQLVPLVRQTANVFVVIVGTLFVLSNLDVNVGALIAGLGIGGIAAALAAQDTMRNLFGGLTVLADRPFQVGDWITVGGVEGTVEKIGFRSTRIRTFRTSVVSVPNATFMDSVVDNIAQREYRRYDTTLHLPLTTPPEAVQAFCEGVRALLQANTLVRQDYYFCEFERFGDSAIEVLLYCFFDTDDWAAELRAKHILNLDVLRLAATLGIEVTPPAQQVRLTRREERRPTWAELDAALGMATSNGAGQAGHRSFTAGFEPRPREVVRQGDDDGEA